VRSLIHVFHHVSDASILDDLHAHLLTAAFALSGVLPGPAPTYENMSPEELEALLVEMEPEIRAADRDMREIEMLEQKGVTAAGKLAGPSCRLSLVVYRDLIFIVYPDYETLQPRLDALLKAHQEDIRLAASLEKRIAALVDRHATHVRTSSTSSRNLTHCFPGGCTL
jgi:hypothetical protein